MRFGYRFLPGFLMATLVLTSVCACAVEYDKDKYDHAWVMNPDSFGLSLKGYSYEMNRTAMDQMNYMSNQPVAPNPSKGRQFWRNLVNNKPVEPVERFGTDVIDVGRYERKHYGVTYPYKSFDASVQDNPYNYLDPKTAAIYCDGYTVRSH